MNPGLFDEAGDQTFRSNLRATIHTSHDVIRCAPQRLSGDSCERKVLSTTARDVVHNFTHYAAMVDAGAEVIITRRGRAPLKLVHAEPASVAKDRKILVQRALSVRSTRAFGGKFDRSEAYDE